MKLITKLLFALSTGLILNIVPESEADANKPTVYVWNFSTPDRAQNELTKSLTREFEEALTDSSQYRVLDRRDMDRLHPQAKIEDAVVDTTKISDETKSDLTMDGADMVIFGEMDEDIANNTVTVTVTFEDWKGEKHLIKEIDIPRDQITDKEKREAAMEQLVQKIVEGNQPVLKIESHSFVVEITKCSGQGEDVTVELQVTDTDDLDRYFGLKVNGNNGNCLLFDNNGYQAASKYGKVSNQEGGGVVQSLLISGIPVKCVLEFGGVPAHATAISRLFLNMAGGGQNFDLTFKNIPIER